MALTVQESSSTLPFVYALALEHIDVSHWFEKDCLLLSVFDSI